MNGSRLLASLLALSASFALLPEALGQFSTPKLVEELEASPGAPTGIRNKAPDGTSPDPSDPANPERDEETEGEPAFIPGRDASRARPDASFTATMPLRPVDAGPAIPGALAGAVDSSDSPDAGTPAPPTETEAVSGHRKAIILPPADGDAQLAAAWKARRDALRTRSFRAAEEHEARLLSLREELGYGNLFTAASAVAFEALALLDEDPIEAKRRAIYATALAPDLPFAHWTVARTAWSEDPLGFGQYSAATQRALVSTFREPRWRSAILSDAVAAAIAASILGGLLALLLVVARHLRCLLHDLRHALPDGASVVQTALLLLLGISLPTALGMGAFGVLAALVLAAWLYMSRSEKVVFGLLVAFLGMVPSVVATVSREASFVGTQAETLYLLERGGFEGPGLQAKLAALAEQPEPSFQVAFALGRQARRHGDVKQAIEWLRRAVEKRPSSPEALVELASALLLFGDLDGARDTYERAAQLAPERGEAYFNLARLFAHKAQLVPPEDASYELGHSQEYVRKTISVDSRLGTAAAGEIDLRANRFLVAMPLEVSALAELAEQDALPARLEQQVSRWIFGRLPAPFAPLVSLGSLGLLGALALASRAFRTSGRCS
jgi:tetratricopeptide (TPR) repeat protein